MGAEGTPDTFCWNTLGGGMLTKNDVLVLGLLLDRPMHGYEIGQLIKSEGIDQWMDVSVPAVYYSLNKLHRLGYLSAARSRLGGVEKSVYHLTEMGRQAFLESMEGILGSEEPVRFDIDLGIFLLSRFPQDRAVDLLGKRLSFLRQRSAELEKRIQKAQSSGELLRAAILEHSAACTRIESEWLDGIIQRLRGEGREVEGEAGLVRLVGDLRDFHLPGLIRLIVTGRLSGTLVVTDGIFTRTLTFQEGRPVCATSRRPEGEVRDPGQILNDIYDLFRWQEGAFTFDQQVAAQEGCLVLQLSPESLILNGVRWVDNWAVIQRVIPSADVVFERREGVQCPTDLELTEEECQVLGAVDGVRDVSDVARKCGLTEFETSKVLYGLHAVGLVQPGDLEKIRLRRLFREFAELMCQSTKPYRAGPDDFSCEEAINQRCADLPVLFVRSRVEDRTDPSLRTEELVEIYRRFLQTQIAVVRERFGKEVAGKLVQQVLAQINPSLRSVLERYSLA